MSVLIKGMEMPKGCTYCPFANDDASYCNAANEYIPMVWRSKFCPMIEVPTPHGRLIDADELISEINTRIEAAIKWGANAIADRNDEIRLRAEQAVATFCETSLTAKKMPTIIEAEEGAET